MATSRLGDSFGLYRQFPSYKLYIWSGGTLTQLLRARFRSVSCLIGPAVCNVAQVTGFTGTYGETEAMPMMQTESKSSRLITWVLSGLAVTVLIVALACVGAAFSSVIGWWAPALATFVAVGVLALAIRMFPRSQFRSR